jgi:hypothetical protein
MTKKTTTSARKGTKKKSWLPKVGDKVIVRTVTHYYTGEIVTLTDKYLGLGTAAWIADTGRWYDALATGSLNEVEPMPHGVVVNLGAMVDISPWVHALPTTQK